MVRLPRAEAKRHIRIRDAGLTNEEYLGLFFGKKHR